MALPADSSPHPVSCSDYVMEEDFMKAARKVAETKKLEGGSKDYSKM